MADPTNTHSALDASDDDEWEFDEAKMASFELTDAEEAKLEKLARPFFERLTRTFGKRTLHVVTNMLGNVLARALEHEAGCCDFYIAETVNEWLLAAHVEGGAARWQLVIELRDEPGGRSADEPPAPARVN
jgi:hypothetical protein